MHGHTFSESLMLYSECSAAVQNLWPINSDKVRFIEKGSQSYAGRDRNLFALKFAWPKFHHARVFMRVHKSHRHFTRAIRSRLVACARKRNRFARAREDFPQQAPFVSRSRPARATDHPQDIRFLTRTVRGAVAETRRNPDRERLVIRNPVLFSARACSHPCSRLREDKRPFLVNELMIFARRRGSTFPVGTVSARALLPPRF